MWARLRVDGTRRDSPVNLRTVKGNAKTKINERPYQILVDTGATLSTLNTPCSKACRWDSEKTGRSEQSLRILTRVSSPGSLQVVPS